MHPEFVSWHSHEGLKKDLFLGSKIMVFAIEIWLWDLGVFKILRSHFSLTFRVFILEIFQSCLTFTKSYCIELFRCHSILFSNLSISFFPVKCKMIKLKLVSLLHYLFVCLQ